MDNKQITPQQPAGLPSSYEHALTETAMQQLWETQQTYSTATTATIAAGIDTPPPTVSGSLHIGHIFSYTQTDIIARYQRLSENTVFYPFGFDDNGLPTERFVEKQRGIVAHQLPRTDFIKVCLEETTAVEEQFKQLWQRMALSIDWDKWYSTIDERSRTISQASFIELFKKGYVYRKDEPAPYCTTCRTSVAQAELDDAEHPSVFYDLQFTTETGTPVTIATTRPELLPACVAVLYHPEDNRYTSLAGQQARVPLFGLTVPFIADESVIKDKGSGLVMCCTFGDKTDVSWYKKFSLPYRPALGRDGKWLPTTGAAAGLNAKKAREALVAELKAQNLVLAEKPITHTVNVHERCKNPIEFLALPQWFIKILPYKEEFLKIGDQISWYPEFMKTRYKNWVENISWDWCISRQRFYGIPFPAWHCNDCSAIILPALEQLPLDPQESAYGKPCPECKGTNITPDTDVMDTWNTSSLTPYIAESLITGKKAELFTEQSSETTPLMWMRPQAHDIIRTWAFYTIVKTWMHHKRAPWKEIVISGHVLSSQQEKISKSQGNSPLQPENLLKTYAADAIRYWTASGSLGHDVAFSEGQLKNGGRLLVKLWNALRMLHQPEFVGKVQEAAWQNAVYSIDNTVNLWIDSQATNCFAKYQQAFKDHEFGLALNHLEQFFWHDLCDNYLELVKDQLFNPATYSEAQRSQTFRTFWHIGLRVLQMYAPFVPHITEKLYQELYAPQLTARFAGSAAAERWHSIHTTRYTDVQTSVISAEVQTRTATCMQLLLPLVSEIRKLKTDHKLSLKTVLTSLTISCGPETETMLHSQEQVIKGIARTGQITYVSDAGLVTQMTVENPSAPAAEQRWSATVQLQ